MSRCRNFLPCAVVAAFMLPQPAVAAGVLHTAGIGDVEIVVPADAPKTVLFAAKELKGFLDAALGGDVPVSPAPGVGTTPLAGGGLSDGRLVARCVCDPHAAQPRVHRRV